VHSQLIQKGEKQMGLIKEFKEFITRGNAMSMAVGVIIGGAFTAIVTSLNEDIITPILGIFGGVDFSALSVKLGSGENAPVLGYGNFITAVINFLITALVIFLIVKALNTMSEKMKKQEEAAPATTKTCPYCQSEIPIKATRCPQCTSELKN
jgi:large conductance mechanosensitive channel